jgi:hypothetical protein
LKIEIDDEIFEFLQSRAQPFVDDPNSVLRRLLFNDTSVSTDTAKAHSANLALAGPQTQSPDTDQFVSSILDNIAGNFRRRSRYRLMFESDSQLLYFQNFNKAWDRLWYRITEKPWKDLRGSEKDATVYFTSPAMGIFYAIPVKKIERKIKEMGWDRDYLEVNIDHSNNRWIELEWSIREFLGTGATSAPARHKTAAIPV